MINFNFVFNLVANIIILKHLCYLPNRNYLINEIRLIIFVLYAVPDKAVSSAE